VTKTAAARERTAALGVMISAWDLGVACGGPAGGLLAADAYSGTFGLAAGASLVAIAIIALWMRRTEQHFRGTEDLR
jgi:predicted MFS family arabinose efflux permease